MTMKKRVQRVRDRETRIPEPGTGNAQHGTYQVNPTVVFEKEACLNRAQARLRDAQAVELRAVNVRPSERFGREQNIARAKAEVADALDELEEALADYEAK